MNAVFNDITQKRLKWLNSDIEFELSDVISKQAIIAKDGFEDFKSMAHYLKAELDEKLGFGWNVIIGEKFSGKFKNRKGYFAYFRIGTTYFLCFKGGVWYVFLSPAIARHCKN